MTQNSNSTQPGSTALNWALVSAVNNEVLVKSCLLSSPDLQSAKEVMLQKGYSSAAEAYNSAIDTSQADILVFAHQDVFLPEGWVARVHEAIAVISRKDPNWGVLGAWGVEPSGGAVGFVYDGYGRSVLGHQFEGGLEVQSLDELLLIIRRSSGLRFDSNLAGFHMYGTDICLEAKKRGIKSYAVAAFCIHNTGQYWMLPLGFWQAYLAMHWKWSAMLPITTPCIKITRWCWPMIRWNLLRVINLATGRANSPYKRVNDPQEMYQRLVSSGAIVPGRG